MPNVNYVSAVKKLNWNLYVHKEKVGLMNIQGFSEEELEEILKALKKNCRKQ